MPEIPRRNVHVFGSLNGKEVAGFFQHGGVTISTFLGWINEVCSMDGEWALYPCSFDNNRTVGGPPLDPTSTSELQPGRYVIRTPPPQSKQLSISSTTNVPRTRAYSTNYTHTPHETSFVERIRTRDRRCCITGDPVTEDDYVSFEAAHIFPLSETEIWNELNYKRFIEDDQIAAGFELNSIQQGFLCSSTEHQLFDDYAIAINPDDGYRIYDFVGRNPRRSPHGNIFYRNPTQPERYLPSADLLRDHFRHVKGAGESDATPRRFDPDIDLGSGGFKLTNGSWWSGSEGKKQLEAELADRLWGYSFPSSISSDQ